VKPKETIIKENKTLPSTQNKTTPQSVDKTVVSSPTNTVNNVPKSNFSEQYFITLSWISWETLHRDSDTI
jgi:hypothetical protein